MDNSIWYNDCDIEKFDKLSYELKTDVLIIGGGIAGILTAFYLTKNGVDCAVVEKNRICSKTTGNTTGKITAQHGLIYSDIIKYYGADTAKEYLDANTEAIKEYNKLSKTIDCDFEIKDNYVFSENNLKKLYKEINALEKIGYHPEFITDLPIPVKTVGAVKFKNQAQFHPLKFIKGISKNLKIFENTFVLNIDGKNAMTNCGRIRADKIIIATHFPFIDSHGGYFLKLFQHRSYVLGIKAGIDLNGMYVSEDKKGMSFRNYGDYILLGGGGHRTGKQGGKFNELENFAAKHYKDGEIKFRWAAQDCISLDGMPYIGSYSKNTPNLLVATGFNKWGMTGSMVAAKLLTDKILNKNNKFSEVFSPRRSLMKPQLAINGFESVTNILNPFGRRCTHLGCSLKWNKEEHSWDCPCHGSRFTEKGKIIENPANEKLKIIPPEE